MDAAAAFAILIPALASALGALTVYAKAEAKKSTRDRNDLNRMYARVRALEDAAKKAGWELEPAQRQQEEK